MLIFLRRFFKRKKRVIYYHGNAKPDEVRKLVEGIESGRIKTRPLGEHKEKK